MTRLIWKQEGGQQALDEIEDFKPFSMDILGEPIPSHYVTPKVNTFPWTWDCSSCEGVQSTNAD